VAEFKNNRYVTGQQNISCGGGMYLYTRQKGDTIIATMYGENFKGLRYETYRIQDSKRGELFTKYYAADGAYMGKRMTGTNGYINGIEVTYYRSPMRIREVRRYDAEGYTFASDYYYPNGKFREKFEEDPELKRTYFNKDGEVLGELLYQMNQGKLKPWSGRYFTFYYEPYDDDNGRIQNIRDYKDGKVAYEELRYKNNIPKSKTFFKDAGKEKQISYNETGEEIGSIEYDNYRAMNGIEVIGDRMSTYKDGVLVAETNYYPTTKKVLSEKTNETETYYDKQGKVLGILKYDVSNNYPKPWEGTKFTVSYKGEISDVEEYENGFVTKRTSFRNRAVGEKEQLRFKRIETFEENGYDKLREVLFYSNGKKQSETDYKKYNKTFGTFYDKSGNLLGRYDYIKKDGTLYEFFGDSDEVRLMEVRKETKLLKSKIYTYGPNRKYGAIDPVLIEDFDLECCAKFYTPQGDLLAECSFKNQKPWSGTAFDAKDRKKYTLKEGKRNGPYQKMDYNYTTVLEEGQFENDKEQGRFNYYDYAENLIRTENFTNGQLDGETIYYNLDGSILTKLSYENGKPVEGTKISKPIYGKNLDRETYKAGVLLERISETENGKRVTTFENGKEKKTIAYYPDSDKKRLTYMLENGSLNGLVVNYDLEGKEKYKATIENGKLIEGTLYLKGDSVKGRPSYIIVNREKETLTVKFIGKDDKVLFAAEEKLAFGTNTVFMQSLNVYMDYLGPNNLY